VRRQPAPVTTGDRTYFRTPVLGPRPQALTSSGPWAVPIHGLTMKAVNLLPSDLRGSSRPSADTAIAQPEPGGAGAFVVLGVLVLCVVALAAYVLTNNTIKDRRAELETVTAEAQTTVQRAAALKPYADFDTMAKARVQTVRDLAASRFDWEQALRDISRAIPGDVTLTYLGGSVSNGSGGGNALRGAIASPAIELKGCTATQPAVARLMARLRAVDGVTRVSLSKSIKPEAATQSGPGVDPTGCGKDRPPVFEMVIFFERSEVPATVQDITVSPQVAAEGEAPAEDDSGQPATDENGEVAPEATPAPSEEGTS
jgi:Tfp pilus assembly protein PilN